MFYSCFKTVCNNSISFVPKLYKLLKSLFWICLNCIVYICFSFSVLFVSSLFTFLYVLQSSETKFIQLLLLISRYLFSAVKLLCRIVDRRHWLGSASDHFYFNMNSKCRSINKTQQRKKQETFSLLLLEILFWSVTEVVVTENKLHKTILQHLLSYGMQYDWFYKTSRSKITQLESFSG